MPPPGPRRDVLLAILFALLAAAFRLPRLGFPEEEIFDEVYHAKAAWSYLHGENPVEWVHPPTAKSLIAVGVFFFGYHPWSWRLAPAFAGILLAPVFFLLARKVLETERGAILATVLLLSDGVYLVQSRTAMTNIFAVLFQVSAALFVVGSALKVRLPVLGMVGAGVSLGLALSSRWTSLWATGYLGLVYLVLRRERILALWTERGILLKLRELGLGVMTFVLIPPLLYFLSYWIVPVLRPPTEGGVLRTLGAFWDTQKAIWHYHASLNAQHTYFSKWWTWPWLYRPTWYYYKPIGESVYGILALGNPALWWASVPVTIWALLTGAREQDPRRLFTGFGFCALYLPWGLSPRTLNFSHYLFEALPYACLSLGVLLDREWDGRFAPYARGYTLAVVLVFLFFLPILLALPIPITFLGHSVGIRPFTWFPSWI